MTQDEIIEIAKQAWISEKEAQLITEFDMAYISCTYLTDLVAFAKLVAAKEREACAKVSEEKGLFWKTRHDINPDNAEKAYMASQFIADAIRTRGEA